MFGKVVNKFKKAIDSTEQIDDIFYAKVMDELSNGYKDKALVGKAIAQSDGNEAKFDSIYIKLRAQYLQEKKEQEQKIEIVDTNTHHDKLNNARKQYNNGYFHNLFREDIKQKGFTSPWYAPNHLFKNNIEYYTKLDLEEMKFLIVSPRGEVLHSFKFILN